MSHQVRRSSSRTPLLLEGYLWKDEERKGSATHFQSLSKPAIPNSPLALLSGSNYQGSPAAASPALAPPFTRPRPVARPRPASGPRSSFRVALGRARRRGRSTGYWEQPPAAHAAGLWRSSARPVPDPAGYGAFFLPPSSRSRRPPRRGRGRARAGRRLWAHACLWCFAAVPAETGRGCHRHLSRLSWAWHAHGRAADTGPAGCAALTSVSRENVSVQAGSSHEMPGCSLFSIVRGGAQPLVTMFCDGVGSAFPLFPKCS